MTDPRHIGEFEQLVLLSVLQLGRDAFGIEIRALLKEKGRRSVSRGALYKTLERLAHKGLLTWEVSDSTPDRGGLPRRRFSVTPEGVDALRQTRETLLRLWTGLEKVIG